MADEQPISYEVLAKGTPMFSSSGASFGTVEHVLQDAHLDLFDGIVVVTKQGLRFVDRDQLALISAGAVRTTLTDAQVAELPKPDGEPVFSADAFQDEGDSLTARLGRLFRREHWKLDK